MDLAKMLIVSFICCAPLFLILVIVAIVVAVTRSRRKADEASEPSAEQQASAPAGWYPDPMARHEYRQWDGTQWTAAVSDNGVVGSDPPS